MKTIFKAVLLSCLLLGLPSESLARWYDSIVYESPIILVSGGGGGGGSGSGGASISCTNQVVTDTTGAGTCTTLVLASAYFSNQGTTVTLLHGNAAGNPSWGAVVSADLNITTTTCTNQFVTALSSGAVGTCTTATLAGAQFANQGTTTTLLHGNAAGNPSFGAVVSADHNITATTCGAGDFISAISATVAGTCATPSGGSAWTGITAGSGATTTANGDSAIVYQTAQTTAGRLSWRFTESVAGVSTGTPVLFQVDTIAASTALPILISARGTEVFRVPAAGGQITGANGSASVPLYSFTASPTTGFFSGAGDVISTAVAGVLRARWSASGLELIKDSSAGSTAIWQDFNVTTTGTPTAVASTIALNSAVSAVQGAQIGGYKARGGLGGGFTVITSGDIFLSLIGDGYVGGTNTYQQGAKVDLVSGGVISDSATGIGGLVNIYTAIVGAEPALRMRIDNVGHVVYSGTVPTMGACGTDPSVVGNDMAMEITVGTGGVATSCAITFANAWLTNAPQCVAESDTDIVAVKSVETTSTATFSVTAAFTASSKLEVLCFGRI